MQLTLIQEKEESPFSLWVVFISTPNSEKHSIKYDKNAVAAATAFFSLMKQPSPSSSTRYFMLNFKNSIELSLHIG